MPLIRFTISAILAVVLVVGVPTLAQAQSFVVGWGWLLKLSGPGPFQGIQGTVPAYCRPNVIPTACIRVDFGYFWTASEESRQRFGAVQEIPMGTSILVETSVIDVGGGIGVSAFTGDRFKRFYRLSVQPVIVDVRPFLIGQQFPNDFARAFTIRVRSEWLANKFDGADFGSPDSGLNEPSAFHWSFGVAIDLAAFR